jgi:hypothetical protein
VHSYSEFKKIKIHWPKYIFFIIFTVLLTSKSNPMTKKLILATIAGSVVQFLLGWLIYGLLLANFMNSQTTHYEGLMKDMSTGSFIVLIFISGLVMSFLIAFIFQRWAKFEKFLMGLTGGMLLGFFMALSYNLSSLAMENLLSISAMIVDVIVSSVVMGIVGAVIAWILGFKSKTVPAQ